MLSNLYRRLTPHSLHPSLTLALTAAALLMLVCGGAALHAWHGAGGAERGWVLAMLGAGLLLAWLAARALLAAGRALAPQQEDDAEIGDMAHAVDRFLRERAQMEQNSAELSQVKERLAAQNLRLQQEAVVRLQAERDLRGLMAQQQTILENVGVGIAFLQQRVIVRCNASFAAMFGYTQAELHGMSTSLLHVSQQAYLEHGGSAYAAVGSERTLTGDMQLKRRDGSVFWVERTLTAVDRADLSLGAIWVVRDIDRRKRAEALRLEQGRVLEMIASGMPLEAVLDSLARLAEAQCDGMRAAIRLLGADGQLHHGAAPGMTPDALAALAAIPPGPHGGSCGAAVARAETVIVSDALSDPLWRDWRPLAAAHGWRACWSTPILSPWRQPLGTLALYAGQVRTPEPAERQMLDVASRIAGIAIERRRSEERIRHMAHHDALTGLPNRTLLNERLSQALARGRRDGGAVTVAFIDLDNFKLVNDSLGHNAGDILLKAVAQRVLGCVGAGDTVVRLGGDEFVLVLCERPQHDAAVLQTVQQIRAALAQPLEVGGRTLQVCCSMGLASFPADGADGDTLLMHADAAMYRAKELGRNNFQFYGALAPAPGSAG